MSCYQSCSRSLTQDQSPLAHDLPLSRSPLTIVCIPVLNWQNMLDALRPVTRRDSSYAHFNQFLDSSKVEGEIIPRNETHKNA